MKPFGSRIAGDNNIWVVAELLQWPSQIFINIIIGGRRQPKKFNV